MLFLLIIYEVSFVCETFPAVEEHWKQNSNKKITLKFIAWIILAWMHHKTIIKSI